MAMADGYAQASGKLAVVNLHVAPGLGNAMGMLYDAQKARRADSRHRRPARPGLQRHRADPVGRPADDRAPAGEMVGRGAPPRRSAAHGPPRREDRARATDRAGVPVAAGRRAERRGGDRSRRPDPRRARHPRRPRRDRGGGDAPRAAPSARSSWPATPWRRAARMPSSSSLPSSSARRSIPRASPTRASFPSSHPLFRGAMVRLAPAIREILDAARRAVLGRRRSLHAVAAVRRRSDAGRACRSSTSTSTRGSSARTIRPRSRSSATRRRRCPS